MKQTYEYMHVTTAMDSIEIEDTGNCYIKAYNDEGFFWVLFIETYLGISTIIESGPFTDECIPNENSFIFYKYSFEYKETKLDKIIDKFINNPSRIITQVFTVDEKEITECLDNLKENLY